MSVGKSSYLHELNLQGNLNCVVITKYSFLFFFKKKKEKVYPMQSPRATQCRVLQNEVCDINVSED